MRSRFTQYGLQARRAAKWLAIRGGLEAISLATTTRLITPKSSKGVIFTMHHVRPEEPGTFAPNAHLSITPGFLDKTIEMLLERGWTAVHLDDMPGHLNDPDDNGRYMAFTLDDGYRDNQQFAQPVFQKHGVPFTVFVTAGFSDRTRTIWWETLEQMLAVSERITLELGEEEQQFRTASILEKYVAFDYITDRFPGGDEDQFVAAIDDAAHRAGVDPEAIVEREILGVNELRSFSREPLVRLGAHTVTHISLAHAALDRMVEEIRRSADFVAEISGKQPESFAFPYGDVSAACHREFNQISELGFSVAVTTRPGLLHAANSVMPTAMPRVSLNGHHQNTRYVSALLSGLPFVLRRPARPKPAQPTDRAVSSASYPPGHSG